MTASISSLRALLGGWGWRLVKLITVTHANLNTSVELAVQLIAGFYTSPGHKCTHIVASGGAIFPAKETVEEIRQLLNGAENVPNGAKEAQTNGS